MGAQPLTPSSPSPAKIVLYDFEQSTDGWQADWGCDGAALASSELRAYRGRNALVCTHQFESGHESAAVSIGLITPKDLSGYTGLSAWLWIPDESGSWQAQLYLRTDSDEVIHWGPLHRLSHPGWNQVTFPTGPVGESRRRVTGLGVHVKRWGATGTASVYVDDVGAYLESAESSPSKYSSSRPDALQLHRPVQHLDINDHAVPQYGRWELNAILDRIYDNPFDPSQIRVEAELSAPSGARRVVPGYFVRQVASSDSADQWQIRFSPDELGRWTGAVVITAGAQVHRFDPIECVCLPAIDAGPIRVARPAATYFEHANGAGYYPIGHNVAWGSLREFELQFEAMARHGENWSRVWLAPWDLELEWSPAHGGLGLGRYNLSRAEKLDQIFALAERYGIYVQLVLHNHGRLSTSVNAEWDRNPYNAALGGPCHRPADFFTDEQARALTKQRLRYLVARWGASSNLLAWELFNEVNFTNQPDRRVETAWHQEMARELKAVDPQHHLVTTSYYGLPNGETYQLPEIDYTQFHLYTESIVETIVEQAAAFSAFGKPYFMAEFGRSTEPGQDDQDTTGRFLHTGLWAQFFTPTAGDAMPWWWDTWIRPRDLFYRFAMLRRFSDGIDRRADSWRWQAGRLASTTGELNALSLASAHTVLVWVYDPRQLPTIDPASPPSEALDATVTVRHLPIGTWQARVVEPYAAREATTASYEVTDGALALHLHSAGPDLAIRLDRIASGSESLASGSADHLPELVGIIPFEVLTAGDRPRTQLRIPRAHSPITIDGDLAEWAEANFIEVVPNDGRTPEDHSVRFAVRHDADSLWLAVAVRDSQIVRTHTGNDLWKDDGIEVWLDVRHDADRFNNMPQNPGLYQINFAPPATDGGPVDSTIYRNPTSTEAFKSRLQAAARHTTDGYVIEARIPIVGLPGAEHGLAPVIGFNLSSCDQDPHAGQPQWKHLLWQGTKEDDATQWADGLIE